MTINAQDAPYYADGTGTVDTTANLQLAINDAIANKEELYIPGGSYLIGTPLYIFGTLLMRGAGKFATDIVLTSTTQNGIVISSSNGEGSDLRDFGISSSSRQTTGYMIYVTDSMSENSASTFVNIRFQNAHIGIYFERAGLWTVDRCRFYSSGEAAIYVENQHNGDAGDSNITNCVIANDNSYVCNYGIYYKSSAGLRIVDNKINNCLYGIVLTSNVTPLISDLLIIGNSIENCSNIGIVVQADTSVNKAIANIVITGNQIALMPYAISLNGASSAQPISNVTISGNVISAISGSSGYSIYFNNLIDFCVSGNVIRNITSTKKAMYVSATCSAGQIGLNQFSNTALPAIDNLSTGTFVLMGGQTGYGSPSNGLRIASFNGATATPAQTAQLLAQLVKDLENGTLPLV